MLKFIDEQQSQQNYPPPSTSITFNPNYPNWQPQQPKQSHIISQQLQEQLPLKRERKPIIITDQNTHELINLKEKTQQKTEQTATTQLNDDNKQSISTSTSNRNINSQQQDKPETTPMSTNTQLHLEILSYFHNINKFQNHDVQLRTTDNAFKPVKTVNAQLDDAEKVIRGVRAILNKLTPQNFQKLFGELVNLEINADDNRLRRTVDIIFENSIKEPKLSAIYANLCKALNMVNNTLFSLKTLIT